MRATSNLAIRTRYYHTPSERANPVLVVIPRAAAFAARGLSIPLRPPRPPATGINLAAFAVHFNPFTHGPYPLHNTRQDSFGLISGESLLDTNSTRLYHLSSMLNTSKIEMARRAAPWAAPHPIHFSPIEPIFRLFFLPAARVCGAPSR